MKENERKNILNILITNKCGSKSISAFSALMTSVKTSITYE